MKIDWKRKLSSRKFWAALAAFFTSIFAVFGVPEMTVGQITAIITAVGSLVVYILAETEVDKAAVAKNADAASGTASGTASGNSSDTTDPDTDSDE